MLVRVKSKQVAKTLFDQIFPLVVGNTKEALKDCDGSLSDALTDAVKKTANCMIANDEQSPTFIIASGAVNYSVPLESKQFSGFIFSVAKAVGAKGLLDTDVKKVINAMSLCASIDAHEVSVSSYNEYLDGSDPTQGVVLNTNEIDGKALVLSNGEISEVDAPTGITFKYAPQNGGLKYDAHHVVDDSIADTLMQLFSNLSKNQFWLIMAYVTYIVSHPRANGLTFPILYLHGNAGTGKTTVARLITKLLGLGENTVKGQPKDGRDLVAIVSKNYVMCFDNCGGISDRMSNLLCSVATGGTMDDRRLHTNTDIVDTRFHQPLIMTAISFPKQYDLCTRALFVKAGKPKVVYASDTEIFRKLDPVLPQAQTWLLEIAAKAMTLMDQVQPIAKHRAADFNTWLAAFEKAAGIKDQSVQQYVNKAQENALNQQVVEHDEFLASIVNVVQQRKQFSGGPTEVHKALMSAILAGMRRLPRNWPQNASALTGKLNRIKEQLAKQGIEVLSGGTRGTNGRKLTLRVMETASVVATPETVPEQPETEVTAPSMEAVPSVESPEPMVEPTQENYYVEELPEIDEGELLGEIELFDEENMGVLVEECEESESKLDWSQMSQEEVDAEVSDFLG